MKRNAIRWVVLLAAISIFGVIIIQIYWMYSAYDLKEKQFAHRVGLALNDVADMVNQLGEDSTLVINPVTKLKNNYYIVELNEPVDPAIIEAYLQNAFESTNIETDFGFCMYDCISDTAISGNYLKYNQDSTFLVQTKNVNFPEHKCDQSYFGVLFPRKDAMLLSQINFWIFSSAILMIIILFFAYTTFIILKQKKLSEITRDFINNMTHEFKTPISTIAVSSEVLMKEEIQDNPNKRMRYAAIIQAENKRLKTQVEKVLQMATLEKDDITLNKEMVDVHQIIKQAVGSVNIALEQKQGKIQTKLKAQQSHIEADKVHLTNIIYNLIDNAIKYSGDNPPEISISTRNVKTGIEIVVEDKGIGIAPDDLKHIFKKFYRVSMGNRHDVKGFGLGLSYVKIMIDKHKGNVFAESEPGRGSRFVIRLPYK
jgi:two-component system, OmpR family, phosphate regulon sensor histidine kinase PhoR